MTPKEKAFDLIDDMTFGCKECDYQWIAKRCALIAVDEILDTIIGTYDFDSLNKYWEEVKIEIENL